MTNLVYYVSYVTDSDEYRLTQLPYANRGLAEQYATFLEAIGEGKECRVLAAGPPSGEVLDHMMGEPLICDEQAPHAVIGELIDRDGKVEFTEDTTEINACVQRWAEEIDAVSLPCIVIPFGEKTMEISKNRLRDIQTRIVLDYPLTAEDAQLIDACISFVCLNAPRAKRLNKEEASIDREAWKAIDVSAEQYEKRTGLPKL